MMPQQHHYAASPFLDPNCRRRLPATPNGHLSPSSMRRASSPRMLPTPPPPVSPPHSTPSPTLPVQGGLERRHSRRLPEVPKVAPVIEDPSSPEWPADRCSPTPRRKYSEVENMLPQRLSPTPTPISQPVAATSTLAASNGISVPSSPRLKNLPPAKTLTSSFDQASIDMLISSMDREPPAKPFHASNSNQSFTPSVNEQLTTKSTSSDCEDPAAYGLDPSLYRTSAVSVPDIASTANGSTATTVVASPAAGGSQNGSLSSIHQSPTHSADNFSNAPTATVSASSSWPENEPRPKGLGLVYCTLQHFPVRKRLRVVMLKTEGLCLPSCS
uniref:SH2 domain-containing protein n=1 Tax=Steinernema glaseri TaxID=37863 RepID=A0A1I8AH94_9BILA